MNKKFQKIVALSLLFSMIIVNVSFAQENNVIKKSETVYVTVDGDEIKDKTVSVWLNSDKNIKVKVLDLPPESLKKEFIDEYIQIID